MNKIWELLRRKSLASLKDPTPKATSTQSAMSVASVPADNPITKPEEDTLGRAKFAQSFSDQILTLDSTEGVVVGVLGKRPVNPPSNF